MSVLDSQLAGPRTGLARLPFYYGWVIVAVAALAMTATLPGRTHGLGLITEPLKADLDIDGVEFATLNFWAVILGAVFCLPTGRLIDRLGARAVLTGVAIALGGVVLAMSRVEDAGLLFVLLTLVRGLGQGALSVVSMAIIGKWFTRRLGPAMGVFTLLLAPGFIISVLLVGSAVQQHGWREAWSGVGWALVLGLAPLGWLLVRSTPEACGLAVEEAPEREAGASRLPEGQTLIEALRTPAFWVYTLAASWFGLTWSAITLSNQAILKEHDFDADDFILVMTVLTASGLPANLLGGWLATRWPLGRLLGPAMLLFAGSLLVFPVIQTQGGVVVYALLLGVAGGLITVVFFAVYGRAFGRAHLGHIQGAAQVLSVFASALGPWLLERCRQEWGSYDGFFYGTAPVAALLGLAAWRVRLPHRAAPGEAT
jgi:MFS family permease